MSRLFGLRGFFCRDINKNEAIRTCAAYRGTYEGDRSMNRRILLHSLMLKDTAVRGGDLENMGGVLSDVSPSPDMVALLLPGLFDPGDSLVTARDAGGLEVGNAAQSRSAQVSVEREKSPVDVKVGVRCAAKFKAAKKQKESSKGSLAIRWIVYVEQSVLSRELT
ncbi:hypothetical protein BDZ89DRAFT_1044068 [Hymenopellis radicata]|nr:hypothetical protein BDZ89DRAFT_1044068 [Hymenopellis radicata]